VRSDCPAESEAEPSNSETEQTLEPDNEPEQKQKKDLKSKRQIERVKRRQQNYLQERRAQKRRQVFFSRIRVLFKLCFAVLFSVLLWEIAQSSLWLYEKPLFDLQENHLIQHSQIEPLLRSYVGQPIYKIHTGKLAQALQKRFAVLDHVVVRRQAFPNRLEILVTEKQPWAEIYVNEKQARPYALLAPGGVIDLRDYQYRPDVYRAQSLEKIIIPPRTRLTPKFMHDLQELAWQSRQIKGLHFDSLDARNQQRIILNFREIPIVLGRLNASASERLSRLPSLAPKIIELQNALESIDLRWEEQVSFHKKPNVQIILTSEETDSVH
jgi:cell division septal protein FtsQ